MPALAKISEKGQHDIAQEGRHGEAGQQPVQHGLRGRLVEGVHRLPERGGQFTGRGRGGATGTGGRAGVVTKGGARRLGGGQPAGEVGLHPADPCLVRLGIQPEAARRAHRLQQAVAVLPGPEHMVADAQAPAQLADAQQRAIPRKLHGENCTSLRQRFDTTRPGFLACFSTEPRQT